MPRFSNIVLVVGSLLAGFLIAESVLRILLFNDFAFSASLRDAQYFADNTSDDYWKLRHRWGLPGPRTTHPLLGWLNPRIEPNRFLHQETDSLAARRPVLLYGDSFAQGVHGAQPIDFFLNQDEAFSDSHYLLNYGVGGYGLDQIYLLFKNSVDRYDNPLVVFSLLVGDINRSLLSVRIGQKPYFELADGKLELQGLPLDPDSDRYFAQHPPRITSYFWNLFLYHTDNPGKLRSYLRREDARKQQIIALNRALLLAAHKELTDRNLDFVFLLFRPRHDGETLSWRVDFVKDQLDEMGVPYIWASDVLSRDAAEMPPTDLFLPDGHPSSVANQFIAQEIKRRIIALSGTSTQAGAP
jgi:hypothetical protein